MLDCIDASTLEESESVFTIVLANILSMIEEYGKEKEYDLEPKLPINYTHNLV